MLKKLMIPAFAALCVSLGMTAAHGEDVSVEVAKEAPAAVPQTKCPVMGGDIDKESFVDYKGKRIYFCCDGCDKKFMKNADERIAKLEASGVVFEKTPATEAKEDAKEAAEAAVDGIEVKVEAPKVEGSHKNHEGSHKK